MKAVVIMPVNTPPTPDRSTLASVHLAFYLARRYEMPIMRPNEPKHPPEREPDVPLLPVRHFARGKFDLAFWVAGSHSFCDESYRDAMADVYRRTLINVYVVNDYHLPLLPKAARVAKATGNFYYRWTTVPHHLKNHGDSFVNLNQIAYRPLPPREPTKELERTLLYYGAFRQPRRDMFERYFQRSIPYNAVISTGSGRTRFGNSVDDLREIAAGATIVKKFPDLLPGLQDFGAALYIEDEYSRDYYTCPAMRFYELVAAGVPILFDESSRFTMETAGYDITPYVVYGSSDVQRKIPELRTFAADQMARWRKPYISKLNSQITYAMCRTLHAALDRGTKYIDAVNRIAAHTGIAPTELPQKPPRAKRVKEKKMSPSRKKKSLAPSPAARRKHSLALERAFEVGFIKMFVKPSSTVLDVGCGREAIVAATLAEYPKRTPHHYLGFDENVQPNGYTWEEIMDGVDLMKALASDKDEFSIIVALDLLDRIPKPAVQRARALKLIAARLEKSGTAFVGVTANGYTPDKLERDAKKSGLVVDDRFGVRAELSEIRPELNAEQKRIIKTLTRYYDGPIAATFLATVEPDAATRSIFVLRHEGAETLEAEEKVVRHSPNPKGTARKAKAEKSGAVKKAATKPAKSRKTPTSKGKSATRKGARSRVDPKSPNAVGKSGRARPQGIGAFIRDELRKGTEDAKIIALVRKKFPTSRTQQSDINWNRRKLKADGIEV
jgi:hypothetical protein